MEVTTLLSPTSASLALLLSPLSRMFRVCSSQVAACLQLFSVSQLGFTVSAGEQDALCPVQVQQTGSAGKGVWHLR